MAATTATPFRSAIKLQRDKALGEIGEYQSLVDAAQKNLQIDKAIKPIDPLPARPTDIDGIIDLLVAYGLCQ